MQDKNVQAGKSAEANGDAVIAAPMPRRALDWTRRVWRPAASVLAVVMALLLVWHGFNGKNGLLAWEQKRIEDRELRKDIDDLNQENARLRDRIERLKSSPDEIGVVAREQLHYAKPNEVIVSLPPDQKAQAQPAGTNK
ncbi:MAG: septum formation initiator family protein [Terracidiphilus sp.]|jgi:cell division protein FtsB